MARPSDIETKALATRVPMSDYIQILKTATDKKLSVSEYLAMKIFDDNEELVEILKTENFELSEKLKFAQSDYEEELLRYKQTISESDIDRENIIADFQTKIKSITDQHSKEQSKREKEIAAMISIAEKEFDKVEKKANDLSKELHQSRLLIEESKKERVRLGQIAEGLWNKIHKEEGKVPKYIDEELKKISRY